MIDNLIYITYIIWFSHKISLASIIDICMMNSSDLKENCLNANTFFRVHPAGCVSIMR